MAGAQVAAGYCADMRGQLLAEIADAVGEGDVALVDAAAYANPGDCAITLGTLEILEDLGVRVRQIVDRRHFSVSALERAIAPDTTLLLQGGGNLGDTWPGNQQLRELVISKFPSHRIVQLPQSISFTRPDAAERFRHVVEAHGGVHLMVRDRASHAAADQLLGLDAQVVPDMAFGYTPSCRCTPCRGTRGLVRRNDREARETWEPSASHDWPGERQLLGMSRAFAWRLIFERATRLQILRSCRLSRSLGRALIPGLAGTRLCSCEQWLSRFELVVTDRLHGHILATLIGIPHVLVDNANGKVFAYDDSWPGLPDWFVARSPSWDPEAVDAAVGRLRLVASHD